MATFDMARLVKHSAWWSLQCAQTVQYRWPISGAGQGMVAVYAVMMTHAACKQQPGQGSKHAPL